MPQTIRFFARDTDLPLSLGLVVDFSGSQDLFVARHNKDLEKFLRAVLRPSDQVFAVGFGNHLWLLSDKEADVAVVAEAEKQYAKSHESYPDLGPSEERVLGTAPFDAI